MKTYELVAIIDSTLPKADIDASVQNLEQLLGDNIKDKDIMGLVDLVYPIKGSKRAYFVSYYLTMTNEDIAEVKKAMVINTSVVRYFFYSMKPTEKFLKFADVNKEFEAILEKESEEK